MLFALNAGSCLSIGLVSHLVSHDVLDREYVGANIVVGWLGIVALSDEESFELVEANGCCCDVAVLKMSHKEICCRVIVFKV